MYIGSAGESLSDSITYISIIVSIYDLFNFEKPTDVGVQIPVLSNSSIGGLLMEKIEITRTIATKTISNFYFRTALLLLGIGILAIPPLPIYIWF